MSYGKNRKKLLDKVNNRKIEDIEVKEIDIETGNVKEEGLVDKKGEYEGIDMEGMREKISDIEIVGIFEKENRLDNEEFKREEPIKEANKEGEKIPEVPKLENLIENDLEKGKSEIIDV